MHVPYYRQETDYTCGAASLQMALAYLGKYFPQRALVRHLKPSVRTGIAARNMIRFAKAQGFHCYTKYNATLRDIKHFLKIKLPVIVGFIEPLGNEGHYAVVTRIKENNIILHDPWNGKDFVMSISAFRKRWFDYDPHRPRWMMVISKDEIKKKK